MRSKEREELMNKYFVAFSAKIPSFGILFKISIGLIIFGIFIIYFFNNTIFAGILSVFTGSALFALWIKPFFTDKKLYSERPTAQQMYNWLISDLNTEVKNKAIEVLRLNKNNLTPENFMIVPYPLYWSEPSIDEKAILRRETGDGTFIYNIWKVQVIALTKNYISSYHCTYDWINNSFYNEKTNEFFFDDISSVKNDVEPINKILIGEEEETQISTFVFKVTNMSSDNLAVITKIPELNYSPALMVSLEKAVQALRIILRKRRYDEDQDTIIIEPEVESEENDRKKESTNDRAKNQ
jgi:hypothetical protein